MISILSSKTKVNMKKIIFVVLFALYFCFLAKAQNQNAVIIHGYGPPSSGCGLTQIYIDQILPERKPSASAVGIAKVFCLHYTGGCGIV